MIVSIASDHAGFEEKELLVDYLLELGHDVINQGPDDDARVDYPDFAAMAREHNDANIVTLSGRFVDDATNRAIVKAFLETDFGGDRHAGRVQKIMALEK